jgi:signal transduction histidine kinase
MVTQSVTLSKRTLYLFIFISIVFIAQMLWWIIFQISSSQKSTESISLILENERRQAISMLNTEYIALHEQLAGLPDSDLLPEVISYINNNPLISGIAEITDSMYDQYRDSLYFIFHKGNRTFYVSLDRTFPKRILAESRFLKYTPPSGGIITAPDWITNETIAVNTDLPEFSENRYSRRLRMLVMEGSFFILLILLGLYLTYVSLRRTRQAEREQTLFVQSITHELKIPITSINLFLDTLKRRSFNSELTSELVPKMKQDLMRLNGLIDNILQVRRLWERQKPEKTPVIDISSEVRKYSENLSEKITSTETRLRTDIADNLKIRADISDLVRVCDTLIDNSLKYAKSPDLEIAISLTRENNQAVFILSDNGPGLPTGPKGVLFEKFKRGQSEDNHSIPGSGLGLYIAREFVKRNNGEIDIENREAGGCQVTMRFKLIQ